MFKSFAPNMTDSYKLGHIYQYPAGTELLATAPRTGYGQHAAMACKEEAEINHEGE